jgi:hypothetical protein
LGAVFGTVAMDWFPVVNLYNEPIRHNMCSKQAFGLAGGIIGGS